MYDYNSDNVVVDVVAIVFAVVDVVLHFVYAFWSYYDA